MPFEQIKGGKADPNGSGRLWAGNVDVTDGTATIDYSAELPGVSNDLPAEPVIVVTAKAAGEAVGVASAGTSQAVIDDGTGTSAYTANVVIHEQGGD